MSENMGEQVDLESLDINNLDPALQAESLALDPETDDFGYPPPPVDGDYLVKIKLNPKAKVTQKKTDKSGSFFMLGLEITIIDPDSDADGAKLFDNVLTLQMKGGGCRAAGVLKAIGEIVPARSSHLDLAKQLQAALATEPTVTIRTRWEGSYKKSDGTYQTVVKGMANFPKKDSGEGHKHIFVDPNSGQEINAQGVVTRYSVAV